MGANPVKSRNIELFPKKLWIHNSAIDTINGKVRNFVARGGRLFLKSGAVTVSSHKSLYVDSEGYSWINGDNNPVQLPHGIDFYHIVNARAELSTNFLFMVVNPIFIGSTDAGEGKVKVEMSALLFNPTDNDLNVDALFVDGIIGYW